MLPTAQNHRHTVPLGNVLLTALRRGVVLAVLIGTCAQAAWKDIHEGQDAKEVTDQIGAPLMTSASRGRTVEMWVFDDGAYVLFENGKVRYFQLPKKEPKEKKGN